MTKKLLILLFIAFIGLIILFIYLRKTITQTATQLQNESSKIMQKPPPLLISSAAFANNGKIPTKFTCDGQGINPPLKFENIPAKAKSLVMLMDDPDVPKNLKADGVFDHWVIYNISSKQTEIKENSTPPGIQGLNGSGKIGYTPPCPPDREHRYFFKLYALDTQLQFENKSKVTKQAVIDKMQGHILEQAELVGRYNRPKNK